MISKQNELKPEIQILKDEVYVELCIDTEIRKHYTDSMDGARILDNRCMNDAH